ncbi:Hypothetical predicted protein [Olea europaea subsp. europaea]|uniref:Uncharacterized protein n=1 Tax=Olea europaea subsp. europaea TaxID=158383 RepID=A0A8S0TKH9_OLEEU|nr:Hypothetical predicted protein [Olea europaea subsp. europaea]
MMMIAAHHRPDLRLIMGGSGGVSGCSLNKWPGWASFARTHADARTARLPREGVGRILSLRTCQAGGLTRLLANRAVARPAARLPSGTTCWLAADLPSRSSPRRRLVSKRCPRDAGREGGALTRQNPEILESDSRLRNRAYGHASQNERLPPVRRSVPDVKPLEYRRRRLAQGSESGNETNESGQLKSIPARELESVKRRDVRGTIVVAQHFPCEKTRLNTTLAIALPPAEDLWQASDRIKRESAEQSRGAEQCECTNQMWPVQATTMSLERASERVPNNRPASERKSSSRAGKLAALTFFHPLWPRPTVRGKETMRRLSALGLERRRRRATCAFRSMTGGGGGGGRFLAGEQSNWWHAKPRRGQIRRGELEVRDQYRGGHLSAVQIALHLAGLQSKCSPGFTWHGAPAEPLRA